MRRVIAASVIVLILLILSAIAFYYSQQYSVIPSDPFNAIPTDAAYIIEAGNGKVATKNVSSKDFYKKWTEDSGFYDVHRSIRFIDSCMSRDPYANRIWTEQRLLISAHPTKASDFDFLYLCNIPVRTGERNINSTIGNLFPETNINRREYEDTHIYEITKENNIVFTYAFTNGILLASRTPFLVEDGIRQLKSGVSIKKSKAFSKLRTGKQDGISLYINFLGLQNLMNGFIDSERSQLSGITGTLARWGAFSAQLQNDRAEFTGKIATTDTSHLISYFNGTRSSPSVLSAVVPSRTAFFFELNADDIPKLLSRMHNNAVYFDEQTGRKNQLKALKAKTGVDAESMLPLWIGNSVALVITEAGNTILENNSFAVIRIANQNRLRDMLKKMQIAEGNRTDEKYRGCPIGTISTNGLTTLIFGRLFSNIHSNAFGIVNGHLIVANQIANVKSVIDDVLEKKTLAASSASANVGQRYFDGHINLYLNSGKGENILRSAGNEALDQSIDRNRSLWNSISTLAITIRTDNVTAATRIRVNFTPSEAGQMNQLWAVQLDTVAQTAPFLISGNNGNFFAIQDKKNQLYLLDEAGRIIWKKPLTEPIKSRVFTADYYRNGGSQLLFNTAGALHLIDLKGNNVGSFPVTLPAPASNPCVLAEMDFMQSRVFIGCENSLIYAYELSGKPVTDWNFNKFIPLADEEITIGRIGNTFQLLFRNRSGKLFIANQRGKVFPVDLEVLPQLPLIMIRDSSGGHFAGVNNSGQVIAFEGNRILNAAFTSDSIRSMATFRSDDNDNVAVVTNDTLFIYTSTLSLDKMIPLQEATYRLESSDGKCILVNKEENRFYLIDEKGNIDPSLSGKGSGAFSLLPSPKNKSKKRLVIGDGEGGVYLYAY